MFFVNFDGVLHKITKYAKNTAYKSHLRSRINFVFFEIFARNSINSEILYRRL